MTSHPADWRRVELQAVAEIQTGLAKGATKFDDPVEMPYLRVANVQDGYLDLTEIKTVLIERSRVDRYRLRPGDVLLTEGGDFDKLGRGAVWQGQIENCLHQNHVFVVRPNPEVLLPEFLSAQTSSPYGKQYFMSCAKQTTNLASINSTQLKQFPVLLPPLLEQRKIAQILGTWDAAIAGVEQLIAALQLRKKGLMQRLLTGEVRFPEFEGQELMHTSMGEVCTRFINGGTPSTSNSKYWNGDIPWITGADVINQSVSSVRSYVTPEGVSNSATNVIAKDNLLVVTRTGVGKLAVAPFDVAISQDLTGVYIDPKKAYTRFLFHYLNFHSPALARLTQGTSINGITRETLVSFKLIIPRSVREQALIASVFGAADKELALHQHKLAALQRQKQGLVQRLLTGEVRVMRGEPTENA